MARDMALAGVDRSQLTPPPPPKKPDTLKGKWDNFWYHYKPLVIAVAFVVVVGGVILFQTLTKDTADYEVVAVTEDPLYDSELEALQAYMASCGADIDGDGKVEVSIENLNPSYYDELAPTVGYSDGQKLMNYLSTGEKMLFVFDRVSYDGFTQTVDAATSEDYHFFAPLATTADGYEEDTRCWCWQTDARRVQYGMAGMPEELLFGVRTPDGTANGEQAAERYEQGAALLVTLSETAQ